LCCCCPAACDLLHHQTTPSPPTNTAAPLVGSKAPDFKATAVFDQEFIDVSLSKYKGKYVVSWLGEAWLWC
jgi:hypothetical protein